ncbi:glycine cleavage system aminomethyltransferase GcvT [Luteolibacter yonseiensis]|uniref:Aminomethyltransferase n=1 Tax=Luteolibacter yonseiensis TaxID=1144680 RepID=A0A934R2A8_9BACT|nr:glycine cleavage system aminomethyltransferase GcvT [Luteolibacter yonseiensis]
MSELKSSPLEAAHVALGAKLVPFAGWNMPVQYTSIIDEHTAVRTACGIFDISHMGQFIVKGAGSEQWLNGLLTNNVSKLGDSQGQYTLMLNENGGVIDDLIAYRTAADEFFLVVNASMIDEDYAWMSARLPEGIALENESEQWAGMAIQGPHAAAIFAKVCPDEVLPPRNGILKTAAGSVVCRTGYTGEDGFEFFSPAAEAIAWWDRFLAAGAKACGLGARDSLRLEMGYPLNGNDLSPERSPIEAGLGFFCDLEKGDFIGRDTLARQKAEGPAVKLTALRYLEKGAPPRAHYPVVSAEGETVGELASGVLSPSLMTGIGMAYLPAALAKIGTKVSIEVRGKLFPAEVVKKPFYKPQSK